VRLEGKVCVVTGAAGGIGSQTVRRMRAEGARVVGVDLGEGAPGDLSLQADVTQEDDVARMYEQTHEAFGRIDVLFNNAGISPPTDGSILDESLEVWRMVQEVNLTSVFLCCKHGIPYLLENRPPFRGAVINTASFVATLGAATSQISYTASKGGVLAMTRELGVQFARQGLRINALSPGPVATPLLEELYANDPVERSRRLVHLPTGRFAEAVEMANAVVFLASDESSYVNAQNFLVDGGLTGAYVTPE
jgi:NAD(P)-dependent dehydrogenase (short-subunit alcohol dehydrogenase family)